MRKLTAVLLAGVAGLVLVGLAIAGMNRTHSVHLNGAMEVPVRDTRAQGQAIFHLAKDGESISYKLIVANIENVFMAHIHQGDPGVNGPIVVWLHPSTAPGVTDPPGGGRIQGVIAEGTFDESDFVGPLAGMPLSALVDLMNGGGVYVNVHTDDGVPPPNTGPGDFPGGEIRGDF